MSYANAASKGGVPPSQQPHADPALLNTAKPGASGVADDTSKLNVVSPDFKQNPKTSTSTNRPLPDEAYDRNDRAKKRVGQAEDEGIYLLNVAKEYILRPSSIGGLLGLINIGLLAGAGRAFYTDPELRTNGKVVGSTLAATIAILSAEGALADSYAKTDAGKREAEKAKEEGSLIYRQAREAVLRPQVFGGILGLVNTAILGTVGYYSYINWDKPSWDRRTVSAVTVGLLTLWGGEGYLAEQYRETRK